MNSHEILLPGKVTEDDKRRWKQSAGELAKLARPIVDAIRANHHPHTTVIIEFDRIVVNEAMYSLPIEVDEF